MNPSALLQALLAEIADTPGYLGIALAHPGDAPSALRFLWSPETITRLQIFSPLTPQKAFVRNSQLPQHLQGAITGGFVPVCLLSIPNPDRPLHIHCRTDFPWPPPAPWTAQQIDQLVFEHTASFQHGPSSFAKEPI